MKVYKQKTDADGKPMKYPKGHKKEGFMVMVLDYIGCNTCPSRQAPHHLESTAGPVDLCEKCMDARMGYHVPVTKPRDHIRDAKFNGAISEIMRERPTWSRDRAIKEWELRNGVRA